MRGDRYTSCTQLDRTLLTPKHSSESAHSLYEIEEVIHRRPPDERRAYCQAHAKPLLDQLRTWLSEVLDMLSRKSDTSRAILYARNGWVALRAIAMMGDLRSTTCLSRTARGRNRSPDQIRDTNPPIWRI